MPLKRREAKKVYQSQADPNGIVALVDLDIILYQASCVCDVVSYCYPGHIPIHYKKDAVNYCHANGLDPDLLVKEVTPEPVEFCLHTIKMMIHNIMDKTGATIMRGFLTGKGNYRETIDSRYPYKGNRPSEKPTHFNAAREYLIKQFDAEVVEGCEADDWLGICQTDSTIIASLDKDLDQIKGKHYNWTKDILYEVTQEDADRFFYTQLLTGDSVDNIKGIKGVGPKTAEKLLQDATTCLDMYTICLNEYEKADMDYYDLLENANLLWIQREKDVLWTPPKDS